MFGEISFFTNKKRSCTVRSRTFSEVIHINQHDFLKLMNEKFPTTVLKYESFRYKLSFKNQTDYSMLYIECYRCKGKGHIAINCKFFGEIKGNMKPKRVIK